MPDTQAARRLEALGKQYAGNLDVAFQALYEHMDRHNVFTEEVEQCMQSCIASFEGMLKEVLLFAQASIEETANDIHTMYDERLNEFISKVAPYLNKDTLST